MSSEDIQDKVNKQVFRAVGVDKEYESAVLTRVEGMTLLKYQALFAGRNVLDIGVGTGRTSIYLAPLADRYEAIDYSQVMVDRVRVLYPNVSVQLADMRDLAMFEAGQFDVVFGSNNVIDAVSHEDRQRSLQEFRRVLRPGGSLIFSSHNRDWIKAGRGPELRYSRNPITQLWRCAKWIRQKLNHRRTKPFQKIESNYALLSDIGHDFAIIIYYIDQKTQRQQLQDNGFTVLDVLNQNGESLKPDESSSESASLMYVARLNENL